MLKVLLPGQRRTLQITTVDISTSYVGQSSITTLGTISSGTWQGTAVGYAYGGTGLTALGTANQMLRVNAGATALEYFTPSYLTANQTITLSSDVTGSGSTSITATIAANAVTDAKFRQSAGLSVVGRTTNTTGNVADITGSDGQVLWVNGTSLAFAALPFAQLSSKPTTLAGYGITDSVYVRGGNAFGAASTLGLTDNNNLTVQTGAASVILRTNSVDRLTVTTDGLSTFDCTTADASTSAIFRARFGGSVSAAVTSTATIRYGTTASPPEIGASSSYSFAFQLGGGGLGYQASSSHYWSATTAAAIGTSSRTIYRNSGTLASSTLNSNTGKYYEFVPTVNVTAGTPTMYLIDINPTETALGSATYYGIVNRSTAALNGLGVATPTAILDLAASSTSRASLRIRSGTAPTSPNDGDIWQDGTNIKIHIGGVTRTFTLV
jgi:hypothetical protein